MDEPILLSILAIDKQKFNNLVNDKVQNDIDAGASASAHKIQYPLNSDKYACYKQYDFSKCYETDPTGNLTSHKKKRFYRQVDILNRARHPCLTELFSFYQSDDLLHPAIFEKYYEKGSLQYCFECRNPFFWQIWNLFGSDDFKGTIYTIMMYGIARGIRYLHELKIMHRDIKPGNIVFDENYRPHITDFDLSKVTNSVDIQTIELSTKIYMAPEIIRKEGEIHFSYPADVFSLAIVLYQIAESISTPPVTVFSNLSNWFNSHKKPAFAHTPDGLQELISKMWDPNPEKRPTMDEVCKQLEDENNWISNTEKTIFDKYKNEIDEYEERQLKFLKKYSLFYAENADILFKNSLVVLNDEEYIKSTTDLDEFTFVHLQQLLKLSLKEDNLIEFILGQIYYSGREGIPKDYVLAWRYFSRSLIHGNKKAGKLLNNILKEIMQEEGIQVGKNDVLNVEDDHLFKSLKQAKAQYIMGMIKEARGENDEALRLYLNSAINGCDSAKIRIGILLLKARTKIDEAKQFLIDGSQSDNVEDDERKLALLHLGIIKLYYHTSEINEAIEIFNKLVDEDQVADAATFLTIAYNKSGDVKKEKTANDIAADNYANEYIRFYHGKINSTFS